MTVTRYRIRRDHDRRFGPFPVNVPEAAEAGFGFQVPVGRCVYGVSFTWRRRGPRR